MRRTLAIAAMVIAASCGGSMSPGSQAASLGPLSFDVPEGWQRTDSSVDGTVTSVWAPDVATNTRKESVTVIWTQLPPPRGTPPRAMIDRLLAGAQGSLRGARVTPVTAITTDQGLTGSSIEVTFLPGVGSLRYRRTHVILVDADAALVHVLYTAAKPDEARDAFLLVLNTIRSKEG